MLTKNIYLIFYFSFLSHFGEVSLQGWAFLLWLLLVLFQTKFSLFLSCGFDECTHLIKYITTSHTYIYNIHPIFLWMRWKRDGEWKLCNHRLWSVYSYLYYIIRVQIFYCESFEKYVSHLFQQFKSFSSIV